MAPAPVLVIGIGNPCREDDGAGLAVADAVERWGLSGVEVRRDYQPTVEDSLDCAARQTVVMADASVAPEVETFRFGLVEPAANPDLTSHALSPAAIAALCRQLYDARPAIHLLEVRGYSSDFREGLTPDARRNLTAACAFLQQRLREMTGGESALGASSPP